MYPVMRRVSPRLFRSSDRALVIAVGLWALVLGGLMCVSRYYYGDADDVFLADLWPAWFVATGVGCVWYAWRPSITSKALTGAALVVGPAGRGLGLIFGLVEGTSPASWPRVLVAVALWSMLSFALGVLWRLLIPPPDGSRHAHAALAVRR